MMRTYQLATHCSNYGNFATLCPYKSSPRNAPHTQFHTLRPNSYTYVADHQATYQHNNSPHNTGYTSTFPITLTLSTHHIAIDTTVKELATNHLANTLTPAANVTALATPLFDAPLKPAHHSALSPATPLPKTVTTPINDTNFAKALSTHPNHELTSYLIDGLINGFDIGYKSSHTATLPNNLLSATKHV